MRIKCHFFITKTNKVKSSKMSEERRRMHIMYSRFFMLKPPLYFKIKGRHPTIDIPYNEYNIKIY